MGSVSTPVKTTEASIYRSRDARMRVVGLYDAYVARWPVELEELDVPTRYGSVHVLAWGPRDGRPVLLLHAASMAATSWAPNVAALAEAGLRCYAPDHIGEAGKSQLADVSTYPKTPAEIGDHYVEVADGLISVRCRSSRPQPVATPRCV